MFPSHDPTVGGNNTILGNTAFQNCTDGAHNTLLGYGAGFDYATTEESNILIGAFVVGTTGESHVLRIGVASGTNDGELTEAYIHGIASVSVSNKEYVTIDTTTG